MQDFTKLRVWQHAHRLRLDIHAATRSFPAEERYGLTSQLRRSAASIAANIAESCGYRGRAESARFLQIAFGSLHETMNHLLAARDLGYLTGDKFEALDREITSVRRMLIALLKRMRE